MSRDPRVDPKPGDVLRQEDGCFKPYQREVVVVRNGRVGYVIDGDYHSVPLVEWEERNANAKVIHAAD